MIYKTFNWINWLKELTTWFTTIGVLMVITKTGIQNGAFNDIVINIITTFGFVGYIAFKGLRVLAEHNNPEFWIYHEEEEVSHDT